MWLADGWKDYEVIDSSDGEKLERWGQYILVRPDPQVIWDTPRTDKRWKHPNAHYHRSMMQFSNKLISRFLPIIFCCISLFIFPISQIVTLNITIFNSIQR